MKKQKIQKQTNPISLSAKKNMPKHEQFFTPYKIQWKDTKDPFKNMENVPNSKNFYVNMKSQLINIKNDVAKMMNKQEKMCLQNGKTPIKTISIKNKCQVGIKKQKDYEGEEKKNMNLEQKKVNSKQKTIEDNLKSEYQSVASNYRNRSNSINGVFSYCQSSYKQFAGIKAEEIQVNLKGFKASNPQNSKKTNFQYLNKNKDMNKFVYLQQITEDKYLIKYDEYIQNPLTLVKQKQNQDFSANTNFQNKVVQQKSQRYIKQLQIKIQKLQEKICQSNQNLKCKENQLQNYKCNQNRQKILNQNLHQEIKQLRKINKQLLDNWNFKERQLLQKEEQLSKLIQDHTFSSETSIISQKQSFQILKLKQTILNLQQEDQKKRNVIEEMENHIKYLFNLNNHDQQQIRTLKEQFLDKIQRLNLQILEYKKREEIYSSELQKYHQLLQNSKLKHNKIFLYQQELSSFKQQIKKLRALNIATQKSQIQKQSKNSIQFDTTVQKNKELLYINQQLLQQNQKNKNLLKALTVQNNELKKCNKDKLNEFLQESQNFEIGKQLSIKFNQYIDENYKLKNEISHLKCKLEQIQLKNKFLLQEISIHQNKQSLADSKRLGIQDWEKISQQLQKVSHQRDTLIQKNKELVQFYQFNLMKKQNQIQDLNFQLSNFRSNIEFDAISNQKQSNYYELFSNISNTTELLQSYKTLLEENKILKDNILTLQQNQAKFEFRQKQFQNTINYIKQSYTETQKDEYIQKLKSTLQKRNNYIQNVLINKIKKNGGQDNIDYFIKQLKPFLSENFIM